jgi:predicted  nucleic acid-binding Zn-ribbon protein
MSLVICTNCGKDFEDDILNCPHCGTSQIPQLSKAELRLENMKASRGPMAATYIGLGIGLVLGAVWFTVAALQERATFADGVAILVSGMLGSTVGFVTAYLKLRRHSPASTESKQP